jgi:hypothetical protein
MTKKLKTSKKTEQPKVEAPVVAKPVVPSGRTIVEIARGLKVTPQNARRVARKHAAALGHTTHGGRWVLNPEQEEILIAALTSEKVVRAA